MARGSGSQQTPVPLLWNLIPVLPAYLALHADSLPSEPPGKPVKPKFWSLEQKFYCKAVKGNNKSDPILGQLFYYNLCSLWFLLWVKNVAYSLKYTREPIIKSLPFKRRQWHPTPVVLPGESQRQGSLVGCCLWVTQGRTQLK